MTVPRILAVGLAVGVFSLHNAGRGVPGEDPATALLQRAREQIYALNFKKGHRLLSELGSRHPDSPHQEEAAVLKNILSLGETFAHLRLFSAYNLGRSRYGEETTVDPLSPASRLDSYRSAYEKRTATWAARLAADLEASLKLEGQVPLSLEYPGVEALPHFAKAGIDHIEVIKQGIPPTPSQAQNIEESEEYAGVLAVVYLCTQKDFVLPQKPTRIVGQVNPRLLIYYSNLWLKKVAALIGSKGEAVL